MAHRAHLLLPVLVPAAILVLALVAPAAASAEEGPGNGADPYPGSYRVKGLTTDIRSGDTRRIEGILVLSGMEKGYYRGKADLETKFPAEGGALDAHVLGVATGRSSGDSVVGTAETQLVIGAIPGVDAEFAFAPRSVGKRLLSTWTATFREDGTLLVEIENRGEPDEDYSPTRTELFGSRIQEVGAAAP